MATMDLLRPPALLVWAEPIAAALEPRDWVIAADDRRGHALLLTAGRGTVRVGGGALDLAAPCLAWLPAGTAQAIRVEAGGEGHLLGIADDLLARTIADHPEATALRQAADRILAVGPDRLGGRAAAVAPSFAAVAAEIRQPEPGAFALLAAHLGLILLHLWRLSGLAESDRRGGGSVTLQRFRHLLEMHYREHWPVAAYARALGVTADHLHEACRRGAGQGPLALLHARLVEEAQSRLAQTALPVEQIGYSLGFRDPAYFSRFFRARAGQPPGAYRRAAQRSREPDSFAAWP